MGARRPRPRSSRSPPLAATTLLPPPHKQAVRVRRGVYTETYARTVRGTPLHAKPNQRPARRAMNNAAHCGAAWRSSLTRHQQEQRREERPPRPHRLLRARHHVDVAPRWLPIAVVGRVGPQARHAPVAGSQRCQRALRTGANESGVCARWCGSSRRAWRRGRQPGGRAPASQLARSRLHVHLQCMAIETSLPGRRKQPANTANCRAPRTYWCLKHSSVKH